MTKTPAEEYEDTLKSIIDYAQSCQGRKFTDREYKILSEVLYSRAISALYGVAEAPEEVIKDWKEEG